MMMLMMGGRVVEECCGECGRQKEERHIKEVGQFVHASVKVKVGVNDAGVRHFA